MNYPSINEYNEAILFAEDNFEQLKNLRPVLDEEGNPVMTSGNFAVVFKMKDEQTGKQYAVKCFLREQEGRAEAYRMIAEELEYVSSTFLTPIKYLDKELFVDTNAGDEKEFPVLLMDWVEGETLDKYIRKHLDDQYELSLLAYQFSRLAMWLMPQPFAHGDLKPDNILVKSDGTLVLVDYDGMYVPAMKGQRARELGSPDFRHPSRTEADFNEHIDDFSLASILLSLKAISLQPNLLEEYGASDRLLFSEKDYRNLSESKALEALRPLIQDTEQASLYSLFILALSKKNLSQVSFRLFNLSRPERPQYKEEDLSTKVTEEDLANAWIDEFGVKYSADKKRLLLIPDYIKDYKIRKGTLVICDEALGKPDNYAIINSKLELLYLPSSIKVISQYLIGPQSLCNIIIDKGNKIFDSRDNCNAIIKTERNELLLGCQSTIIPKDITKISIGAFVSCKRLKSIIIPNSVTTIGESAFMNCEQLKTITIPASVKEIGKRAFNGSGIERVVVDKQNQTFDSRDNCNAIIETQKNKLIYGCDKTIIPSTVIIIGENAFECCDLKELILPNDVIIIEAFAFDDCRNLKTIVFPSNLKSIGVAAFSGCKELALITFNNIVDEIGFDAFVNCDSLERVFIPKGTREQFVELKPGWSFINKLVEQVDDEELTTEVTIDDWHNRWEDENGAEYSLDGRKLLGYGSYINTGIYEIKQGTKVICDLAFNNYENDNHYLKGVRIPSSVIAIGENPFVGCVDFDVICDSPLFEVVDGLLYNKAHTRLIACLLSGTNCVEVDPNVTTIGAYCFCYCETETIILSSSIRVVKEHAFDTVERIIIPAGEKLKFEAILPNDKEKLIEVELRTDVTDEDLANAWTDEYGVKYSADKKRLLKGPKEIKKYSVREGTKVICNKSFIACDFLKEVIIPNSVELIGESTFLNCTSLEKAVLSNKLTSISNRLFCGCFSLSNIIIPDGVKCIGIESFLNCTRLNSVVIPDSVTSIGDSAFQNCESLNKILIPKKVIEIGINPIAQSGIREVICKSEQFETDGDALYDKGKKHLISQFSEVKHYIIPDSVISIGEHAFYNCSDSQVISIPNSVRRAGGKVFYGSFLLKSVLIPRGTKQRFEELLPECKFKFVEQ